VSAFLLLMIHYFRQHKSDVSTVEGLKMQKKDMKTRSEELTKESEQLTARIAKIESEVNDAVVAKAEVQNELETLVKSNNEAKMKQQVLSDKLKAIHSKLHEAKQDIEVRFYLISLLILPSKQRNKRNQSRQWKLLKDCFQGFMVGLLIWLNLKIQSITWQ
jgi:chromosome segregation ATPase